MNSSVYYKKRRKKAKIATLMGEIFFFPLVFIYLEIAFHIYMRLSLKYIPVYLLFSIPVGCVCSLLTMNFTRKANRIIAYVLTCFASLIFCIEIVCKAVLQQYYQLFSSAETAANNKLLDYFDAIVSGVLNNWFGLLLMLVPVIFIFAVGRNLFHFKRKHLNLSVFVLIIAVFAHILGLVTLRLPWKGDFKPSMLYSTDTNVDDQVEQLGLMTMLRLDVKHSIFGAKNPIGEADFDFSGVNGPAGETSEAQTDASTSANEIPTETAPPLDTSPNVMNIDFDARIAGDTNDTVKWLDQYFQNVTPTNKNEYTGMFKDYNVIFFSLEGFDRLLIDKDRTPTLYRMANEGFVFNNFYTPLHYTSTSGGEFQNMVGLYPKNGNPISMKETGAKKTNLYFTLGNQLKRQGYLTMGYHNNREMYGRRESHPNMGYDWKQGDEGFTMETSSAGNNVWPQSDLYMMEQTVDEYINSEQPFHIYYMSVSGHMPYNFTGDQMAVRNKEIVEGLPYSETTKAYIAANQEVEKAAAYLLERLEQAGKLDKTLIVMVPDHIPYFDIATLEELAGKSFGGAEIENLKESDLDFDVYRNSLIMWSGSMEQPVQVDKVCGQVDILPTVSNLLGLEYDSRLLAGTDILSDSQPLVIFSSRSWLTDKGLYNRYSGEFTLAEGVTMSQEEIDSYVSAMKKIVKYKLDSTDMIIETDYYNQLFPR